MKQKPIQEKVIDRFPSDQNKVVQQTRTNRERQGLATINNLESVEERNKRELEEKHQKKMEYQKELVKQIEMKRLEIEQLREKERRDEESLTR